jgi:hypothetical protein
MNHGRPISKKCVHLAQQGVDAPSGPCCWPQLGAFNLQPDGDAGREHAAAAGQADAAEQALPTIPGLRRS